MADAARMRWSVGIVGAGALGTLFAALLARAGLTVGVLVHDSRRVWEIDARGGIALEGGGREPAAYVTADPTALQFAEILLVAVKAYATQAALTPLRGVLASSVPIVSLQNGLDAPERIEGTLGRGHPIALAVTTEAATLLAPGLARRAAKGTTVIGWSGVSSGSEALLATFAAMLSRADFACRSVSDIEPHVWGKLVVNAAVNPLTALAGVVNGAVLEDAALHDRAATLAREAAAVAEACGVGLPFNDPVSAVDGVVRATAANRSSMLQDIDAGRPTEIDAINGALVRRARALGIAVPENVRIIDEVRARTKA